MYAEMMLLRNINWSIYGNQGGAIGKVEESVIQRRFMGWCDVVIFVFAWMGFPSPEIFP